MGAQYSAFARHYDRLMSNVPYAQYASRLDEILKKYGNGGKSLLDLACGTGSIGAELSTLGYKVIGCDRSDEMLSIAAQKPQQIQYIRQDMRKLDLGGTVDAIVCCLDSLNHLPALQDVRETFHRVADSLSTGGLFVFDVNTLRKHREILADNAFVFENESVFCAWRNELQSDNERVRITLDFFTRSGGLYQHERECFFERAYSLETLREELNAAGLSYIASFDGYSDRAGNEQSERLVIAARKRKTISTHIKRNT